MTSQDKDSNLNVLISRLNDELIISADFEGRLVLQDLLAVDDKRDVAVADLGQILPTVLRFEKLDRLIYANSNSIVKLTGFLEL